MDSDTAANASSPSIDPSWLSPERFAEFLEAADYDDLAASRLYEWNAEVSAALFELIHHFEVLLRNSIVATLDRSGILPSMPPGSPWVQGARNIEEVRARLKKVGKEPTAGRVYAGLTFGFWQRMFGSEYEDLWRLRLQHVFSRSRANRSVIAAYLESVNRLRNRIAHHGSLIDSDTHIEAQKLIRLASWIDPAAGRWLRGIERVSSISDRRPVVPRRNVLVVEDAAAWELFDKHHVAAYIVPVGQPFQVVDRLAFSRDGEIQPLVPAIVAKLDAVDWNKGNAQRLARSNDADERALGIIMKTVIGHPSITSWSASMYQVFLLTPSSDPLTIDLGSVIARPRRRSRARMRYRYVSDAALRSAHDTGQLFR